MLMKSLLIITLALIAPAVLSAGVSIELETAITVGSVVYTNTDEPGIENWDEVVIDPLAAGSLKYQSVNFTGELPRSAWETSELEYQFFYKDSGALYRSSVSRTGEIDTKAYPPINNGFTDYITINGIPYILDETDNTILGWNEVEGVWVDLASVASLPSGQFTSLYTLYNKPVIGIDQGLWAIDVEESVQVSTYPLSAGPLIYTPNNYFQILSVAGTLNFQSNRLSIDGTSTQALEDMHVNSAEYAFDSAAVGDTGTISVFEYIEGEVDLEVDILDEDKAPYLFVWTNDEQHMLIEKPFRTEGFKGCFTSYPRIFCAFTGIDKMVILFELKDGEFRADTIIGTYTSLFGMDIQSIKALGEKRYGLLSKESDDSIEFTAFVATSVAAWKLNSEVQGLDSHMFLSFSKELGVINGFGYEAGAASLSKITHRGPLEYSENTFSDADQYIFIQERDGEIEKVFPVAELGSFSFMLLFSMLMLLSVRRSKARF